MNLWLSVKRPLFFAFFLACTVSFLTSRMLTLRLIVPTMIYWSFVPLIQIASLAVVCLRDRQNITFPKLIDLFFQGYRPWFLWLFGMCAIGSLLSPAAKSLDWTISIIWLDGGVVVAIVWSLYIDLFFFRSVLKTTANGAVRALAVQRLTSWGLIMAVIGAPTIWSEITGHIWQKF
jgi:hypothetical protein